MGKRWLFLPLVLERGSGVPVLVEDLALVHAHEPVKSYDEHQPNYEHDVVGVCAKSIVDPLSRGVAEFECPKESSQ